MKKLFDLNQLNIVFKPIYALQYCLVVVFIFMHVTVFGQNQTLKITTTAGNVTVCGAPATFTIIIQNDYSQAVTTVKINPNMPTGMIINQDPASLTGATISNPLPENNPTLLLNDPIPSGATATITFQARAGCSIIPFLAQSGGASTGGAGIANNHTTASYIYNGTTTLTAVEINGSESFNVIYPDMDVSIDPSKEYVTANIGDQIQRTIKIKNSGLGKANQIVLRLKYQPQIQHTSLFAFNQILTSFIVDGDSYIYTITQFSAAGDPVFDYNDEIVLTETVKVVACNPTVVTEFRAEWGCDNQSCTTTEVYNRYYVNIPQGSPSIYAEHAPVTQKVTACDVNGADVEFLFYNYKGSPYNAQSANRATNLGLYLRYDEYLVASNFMIWDYTTSTYVPFSSKGLIVNLIPYHSGGQSFTINFSDNPALLTDIDGLGGLEDLDKDGYFDDFAVGSIMKMKANLKFLTCQYTDFACQSMSSDRLQFYLQYSNGCNTFAQTNTSAASFYEQNSSSASITGPQDIRDSETKTYRFTATNNYYSTSTLLNNPISGVKYRAEILLPQGFTYTPNTVEWVDANNSNIAVTLPVTKSGNKLIIYTSSSRGRMDLNFTLNCALIGSGSTSTIDFALYMETAPVCSSCEYKMCCSSYNVYIHCPGTGTCNGFYTTDFNAERTTFSWVAPVPASVYKESDFTNNLVPRATKANSPGMNLYAALDHDEILMTAKGALSGTAPTFSNAHVQIKYNIDGGSNVNFLSLKGAQFIITTPNNGVTTCVIPIASLPVAVQNGNTFVYDFIVPSVCVGSFTAGTAVDLYATFTMRADVPGNGKYRLSEQRAEHFGFNGSDRISCDNLGVENAFTLIKYVPYAGNNYIYPGCTQNTLQVGLYISSDQADDFPNEFRPFAKITSVNFDMPADFKLSTGASIVNTQITASGNGRTVNIGAPTISGTTYTWDIQPDWIVPEGQAPDWSEFIYINIDPVCVVSTTYIPVNYTYSKYHYTANPALVATGQNQNGHYISTNYNTYANLTLSPAATQIGYTKKVVWPLQVLNLQAPGKNANARNTWIAIEPPNNNITPLYLENNGTNIVLDHTYTTAEGNLGYMFYVDDIPLGTTKTFNIVAQYINCVDDQIDEIAVKANWSCKGYPNTHAQSDCANEMKTTSLFLRYKTADLVLTVDPVTENASNICNAITYDVVIQNPRYANMSDVMFWIDNIAGFDPNSITVSASFPEGTAFAPLPAASILPNTKTGWNLSTLVLSKSVNSSDLGELPGNARIPTKDQIKLKVSLTATCEVDPGFIENGPIIFNASGNTNCGTAVAKVSQKKPRFIGFDPLDAVFIDINATDFNPIDKISDVSVLVRNTGTTTLGSGVSANRYMAITLPKDIVFTSFGNATNLFSKPVGTSGAIKYYFSLPPLAAGASVLFSNMKIKNLRDEKCCDIAHQYIIQAVTIMSNNINCFENTPSCTVEAVTAVDFVILKLTVQCPCFCIPSFSPTPGATYILTTWVKETASATPTLYLQSSVSLYFEGSETTVGPFTASGEVIDGWQRIEAEFKVPLNATSIEVKLNNTSGAKVYFDDIRIHPFNSNMKSYVYDPISLRLWAELDENNYATFYEYDEEGSLIRVKKETERGVKTIQESRSNTVKKQ